MRAMVGDRTRRQVTRRWLCRCLALLLVIAPPLNLAGVDLVLSAGADVAVSPGHSEHHHSGQDHSGLAHHDSASSCLQCLALGGMSLAGAAPMLGPAPQRRALGAAWVPTGTTWRSNDGRITVCRGPPASA